MLDSTGNLVDKEPLTWDAHRIVASLHSIPQDEPIQEAFGRALEGTVSVTMETTKWQKPSEWTPSTKVSARQKRIANIRSLSSSARRYTIGAEDLAKNWNIGLAAAKRMLEATTQKGVRTVLHSTLSRRFRTNDRQLRYRRLMHDMFTDTLEAKVISWFRRNRYAQVFATRFGWARVYPMQKKSDAHEGLSLLAQREGVPPTIVMDGSKEQTLGLFRKKARQMGTHIKQTEPHSPWQNAAEGVIREVKRYC